MSRQSPADKSLEKSGRKPSSKPCAMRGFFVAQRGGGPSSGSGVAHRRRREASPDRACGLPWGRACGGGIFLMGGAGKRAAFLRIGKFELLWFYLKKIGMLPKSAKTGKLRAVGVSGLALGKTRRPGGPAICRKIGHFRKKPSSVFCEISHVARPGWKKPPLQADCKGFEDEFKRHFFSAAGMLSPDGRKG